MDYDYPKFDANFWGVSAQGLRIRKKEGVYKGKDSEGTASHNLNGRNASVAIF